MKEVIDISDIQVGDDVLINADHGLVTAKVSAIGRDAFLAIEPDGDEYVYYFSEYKVYR